MHGRSKCPEVELNRKAIEVLVLETQEPLTLQKIAFKRPETESKLGQEKVREAEVSRRQIEKDVFYDAFLLEGEDAESSTDLAWLTSTLKDMALAEEEPMSFFAKLDEILDVQEARKERMSQNDTTPASAIDNNEPSFAAPQEVTSYDSPSTTGQLQIPPGH